MVKKLLLVGLVGCACSKDPQTLFVGAKPELPPPVANAKFGMTKQQMLAAVGATDTEFRPKGYRGVSIDLRLNSYGELRTVDVSLPDGKHAAVMAEQAWGAPLPGKDDKSDMKLWFNPEHGVRAHFTKLSYDTRIFFEAYSPIEKFLGSGKEFAFESKRPIIGSTADELAKAYKLSDGRLRFPPNPCGRTWLSFDLTYDKSGKVSGYSAVFESGYCDNDRAALELALEKKFGKSRPMSATDPTPIYAEEPNVVAVQPIEAGRFGSPAGLALVVFRRPQRTAAK